MNTELIVILSLIAFIGFQQWFCLKQIQKLVDKVMAGNYATYSQSQAFVNESMKAPPQAQGFNVQLPQDGEFDELSQLNAMLRPPL